MKKRLDQLLYDKGLTESRTKAQALIMAGQVLIEGKIVDKVGQKVPEEIEVELKEKFPYVSRGALKLEKAYQEFNLDFQDKTLCDIGSSTGGFTDFALKNGASKVYAVDVGTGQLDQKLREDSRVNVMERTDFREIELNEEIDYFVCDVSFISLKRIIPKIKELEKDHQSEVILLIKPQFEAGKKDVSKGKGVIKDESIHKEVIEEIKSFAVNEGFKVKGLVTSPITGAKGNKEFLIWLRKGE
jgi:23S rRNA (cytidine1920-2'-O)/16S rRNA (cytidine1409-2'-O)-methyltransferase